MTSISKLYEPSPKFGHGAALVGGRCYLWGGRVQGFSDSGGRKLMSTIEVFDPYLETWEKHHTTGIPPPGLYFGVCTSLLDSLYWFGGNNGSSCYHNSLHRLDPTTLEWRELQPLNQVDGPMRKAGCGVVTFLQDKLAVFGGYGIPRGPTQPGAVITRDTRFTDGSGWSNELHVFDITEGKWSSPPTTGHRPSPCSYFSFTAINNHQAVLFGGRQADGRVSDCYLMNFKSMEWTKLERPEGAPWPVERSAHAACCLNYEEEHPQLLVTGGLDKNGKTLQDAWILDIKSGRWRELTLPKGVQPRMWHTVTALSLGPGRTQVTMFGGCQKWEKGKSDDLQQKLAKTTVLEFESVKLTSSGDGTPTREWILVGMADSNQLGSPERLAELEKMKQRKTEHEREREIKELKERACQLEEEKLSSQKQTRLALARAVSAEIEADKVPVLEQQLAQTKTDLEEQIHMKDQARIAAEQQLQQTKAALEDELHMKDQAERLFNETRAGLQHAILVKDQVIATFQQQLHQMRESLEHQTEINKQAMVSAQQQFSHRVKALEHQIELRDQARVDLEMQIQARDREKADLEQQLCWKEEQIQAKEREKVELEQQICQLKEHGPPVMTRVAKMQQEESVHVTAQGEVPIVHQLLQAREEVRTKEEELRQVREEHEAELSRLTHESTAKQQEIEFELQAQLRTRNEEMSILQSQADTLQCDKDDLQQQLKEKRIQITAISSEARHRVEALTADMQKLTSQMDLLDTSHKEAEFYRDHYSQEVDQLREELMDRILEIEFLRKQLNDVVPADTLPTTTPAGGSDKMEVKDQNVQTKFVQVKNQQVQAESATQQQEMKDQQIQKETVEPVKPHVQAGSTTEPQAVPDKVEMKDQNMQTETVESKDQQVQAETRAQDQVEMKHQKVQTKTVENKDQQIQTETIVQEQAHIRGVEVIANETFMLTQEAVKLNFKGYGFKLYVQKNSLPAEVSETQLSVQVSLSGPFQMPSNCELVSAVYWVSSPHKFRKPVNVEIQHCAALSNDKQCSQLTFVHTKCAQKELPYIFKEQEGGVFGSHSSYGSLSLSHFSGIGIVIRPLVQRYFRVHPVQPIPVQAIYVQPVLPAIRQTIGSELGQQQQQQQQQSSESLGQAFVSEQQQQQQQSSESSGQAFGSDLHQQQSSELSRQAFGSDWQQQQSPKSSGQAYGSELHQQQSSESSRQALGSDWQQQQSPRSSGQVYGSELQQQRSSESSGQAFGSDRQQQLSPRSSGQPFGLDRQKQQSSESTGQAFGSDWQQQLSSEPSGHASDQQPQQSPRSSGQALGSNQQQQQSPGPSGQAFDLELVQQPRLQSSTQSEAACQTGQEDGEKVAEQYCGKLYTQKLEKEWKVDFVVTKDLDSCSTVVEKQYLSHGHPKCSFTFHFKEDFVSLKIPEKGELGGWMITPFYKPKITRQQVNCFSSGKNIPKCELLLQWDQRIPPACLQCEIGLIGACDHNYFLLHINPDADISTTSAGGTASPSNTACTTSSDKALGQPTVALQQLICFETRSGRINILEQIGTHYRELGILLLDDTTGAVTKAIIEHCNYDATKIIFEIFEKWIQGKGKLPVEWGTLIEVLNDIELSELANKIKAKTNTK